MRNLKIHIIFIPFFLTSVIASAQVLVDWNSQWSYFKGTSEPSQPKSLWLVNEFNETGWAKGNAPFRYGDGSGGTKITDMPGNFTTVYLRKQFILEDLNQISEIRIFADYDDGFVLWINGKAVLQNNAPLSYSFNQTATGNHESGEWESFVLSAKDAGLVSGTNLIAIQGFNVSLSSSDFYLNFKIEATAKLAEAENVTGNMPSGFYEHPFRMKLSGSADGEKIKYTLDGSDPRTSTNVMEGLSPVYLIIDPNSTAGGRGKTGAVVLRASKFVNGFDPSIPITRTYIFVDAVKSQTTHPGGSWPTNNTNGQKIDLLMDTKVTEDIRYKNLIQNSLLDIPSISVTTDPANLFDPQTGIYVNAQYHGKDWERPANIELLNPDKSKGFNIDAGIRIRGGWSRHDGYPKHAFRLFFRSEYGKGKLEFPLFGNDGVNEFDKIDLRTSQNYSWANGGGHSKYNTMNRDVFSRDTQKDMNRPYTRSRYYHLYLNGLYWGVYQTQERAEANFAESYFGGDKENYDVIKIDIGDNFNLYQIEATDGNTQSWNNIWNMCQLGFASNYNYFTIQGLNYAGAVDTSLTVWVDIDNLIDYMLIIFYAGNFDSPVSKFSGNYNPNNFFIIDDRTNKRDGFKFFIHDAEHTLLYDPVSPGSGVNENRVNIGNIQNNRMNVTSFSKFQPQWLHFKLSENKEYRMRFADRVYRHFFNTGVFTPDSCISRFLKTSNQLNMAIIAESARWGDSGNWPPRTKDDDWVPAVNQVTNNYMPVRSNIVLNQLLEENLYVNLKPPIFKNNGIEIIKDKIIISGSYNLLMENQNQNGTIFYTTDGSDPRAIGGANSVSATNGGNSISLNVTPGTRIKARVKNSSEWSAVHEIVFEDSQLFTNLKVTELHYHPLDWDTVGAKQLEFIELKNIGNTPLDLSGLTFTDGISFTFPQGTTLAPLAFVVIASNPEQFKRLYGFSTPFGYSGSLSNGGERVALETSTNQIVIEFTYYDTVPWPTQADGDGFSLVSARVNPTGDPNNVDYWAVSKNINGSPMANDEMSTTTNTAFLAENTFELKIYPNPASAAVNIDFTLQNAEKIEIGLYEINGRLLQTLVNEHLPEGFHNRFVSLNAISLNSGIYLVRFKSNNNLITKKLIYQR